MICCRCSGLHISSLAALAGLLLSALAQAGDTLELRIASCKTISDSVQRLTCFDSIESENTVSTVANRADSSRTLAIPAISSGAPAAVPAAAPARPPATGPQFGTFGSETVQAKPAEQAKNLAAKVVGAINGIGKGQKIRLDNGQVWLNTDDRSYDYEATAPDVTITRNFAGNYWMKLSDSSFQFRVRRIQ